MKALFLGLPFSGHVNPTLPLVRELVGRGHDVLYYASEPFAADVEEAGGVARAYRTAILTDLAELPSQTDELSWLLMRAAADVLDSELEAFRAARPDYVIADSVAPWGQWVGKILRVPVVTSISTFAFNRHVMAFGAAHGVRPTSSRRLLSKLRHMGKAFQLRRRLCRAYGVDGPGVIASVIGSSDLNIVYTSRYFQPCAETFDERFEFVGPMTSRAEPLDFPWDQVRLPDVVYVSFGTLFNTNAAFYRRCFEALGGLPFQVIMSTGSRVSPDTLGPPPPNFIVASRVPQLSVLQRVRAFVTHGGMNSVSESLSFGVPMVVIPQMGEQAIVARRVEQLGAGLCLTDEQATPSMLRESVERVFADDRFRRQADVIRQSFGGAGGAGRAADAVEAFVAAGPRA